MLENDNNAARYLERRADGRPRWYQAQWDDDVHHALHVLLTGEGDGYYQDYVDRPAWYAGRALAEGFAYQGEPSGYRDGRRRGEPSAGLPPTAFVSFLQNHDQVGNRAFGERIDALAPPEAVRAAAVVRLLSPAPPLLFMGEEFAAATPFLYFCDFAGELAQAVSDGRRAGFARTGRAADRQTRRLPDPNAPESFARSKLDWDSRRRGEHAARLALYRELLRLRQEKVVPRLRGVGGDAAATAPGVALAPAVATGSCPPATLAHPCASSLQSAEFQAFGATGFRVAWRLADGSRLQLVANLGKHALTVPDWEPPGGNTLYVLPAEFAEALAANRLPPWSVGVFLG